MATRLISDVVGRVDAALSDFAEGALAEIRKIGDELDPVADVASTFLLDGGKRLRPCFAYWGYRAAPPADASSADDAAIVRAVASLELIQAAALVHDDVIDRSDTRRGQPAAHRRFGALHRHCGWTGDPDDFGTAAAILLGDLFLVWADAMFTGSAVGHAALTRSRPVYDAMRVELMSGQYLDVVEQVRGDSSVERALRVARLKAATYTIERPLHLGAALAGAGDHTVVAFSAYGVPLGEAFQLRDDLLGVFGDPAVTGKPAGDDLREGKRTALIALAIDRASPAQREVIDHRLGDPELDATGVDDLRGVVVDTRADQAIEAMITTRWETAVAALGAQPMPDDARAALRELADAAVTRVG